MKVLITGGGTGIGRAVAETILFLGGQVVVVGRRKAPLDDLANAYPQRAFSILCDVADKTQREGLLRRAQALLGSLDGFVHSAGVVHHQLPGAISDEALEAQLNVNLIAPLRLGEQALEVLAPGGAMVFVGSTLAKRPVASSAVYSATKAGLMQVMKVMALQGAPRELRANAVLPGIVETDMVADRVHSQRTSLESLHVLKRLGRPEEIASTVWHLLQAKWMTGSEVTLDGGLLLRE